MHKSQISNLSPIPPDALLGLMAVFREDSRPEKIDLGVGVYKDKDGQTPVMEAVKLAEAQLLQTNVTKAYEGPHGNQGFCRAIEAMVVGQDSQELGDGHITSFATPGGCGALSIGLAFLKRLNALARIWISVPCWPNYQHLIKSAGLGVERYPYFQSKSHPEQLDFTATRTSLQECQPGDGIIIQGPCHNPTGRDLTLEEWTDLGKLCREKNIFPVIDIAYHGFAESLANDMMGVRAFLEIMPEALISYSCSKNFGLYRERTGCLIVKTDDVRNSQIAASHLASIARAGYSMPPAHGAAIVATILGDANLRLNWESELENMRRRILAMRTLFSDALIAKGYQRDGNSIRNENGMFSVLDLEAGATETLRKEFAIYMPKDGRINFAGMNNANIQQIADCLAPLLKAHVSN